MIQRDLGDALVYIKQMFGGSPDVIDRSFQMGSHSGDRIAAVYIDGLSDKGKINDYVAQSLIIDPSEEEIRSMEGGGGIFEVVLARSRR